MLYIENTTAPQRIFVPLTIRTENLIAFSLKSTMEKAVRYAVGVTRVSASASYYMFDITLQHEIPNGEYIYTLTGNDGVLSEGIAVVGSAGVQITEHNEKIEYKQYE